ncbi:MAG TPA: lycopene cyclase domain-containing protein [Acidimicrobiales bacterium]
MPDRWQYLAVLAGCLLVTLPLEVVLGARVYRRPRRLARSLVPALVVFVAWDVAAIGRGHWWFSERYTTGWRLPGDLPVEELAFFVVIPICALLTYEAVTIVLDAARRAGDRRPGSHQAGDVRPPSRRVGAAGTEPRGERRSRPRPAGERGAVAPRA